MKNKFKFITLILLLLSTATFTFAGGNKEVKQNSNEKLPDTVRLNIATEPDSLNPWISAASDTYAIFNNVFEGLMSFDDKGVLYPQISSSYTLSQDKLTYTFKLRDDIYFHNNKHLTSDDVLYSYESFSENSTSKYRNTLIESISTPDDYTFIIKLKEPSSSFLIATATSAILPRGYEEQSTKPIGTGPYKFVSYTPSQKIVFVKNDSYYDESHMPSIKNIEVYIMSDSSSVVAALQSGQIDIADIASSNAEMFKDDHTVISGDRNLVSLLVLNNKVTPLNDVRVRKALTMAIKKTDVIDGVFDGFADPVYSNLSPVFATVYNDELVGYYQRDIEKAKTLLTEAGYPNGFDLEITVPGIYWQHVDTAQIVQQNLSEIGVNVTIKTVEWGTWLEDVYYNRNYTSTIIGIDGKLDPFESLNRYESNASNNFMNYSNSEYDALIEKSISSTEEEKVQIYKDAQKIVAEDAACAFICSPKNIVAIRPDLKGYKFYPVYFIDFTSLYYN
jgi:peptide/nickel transport system substrate-binding protein